MINLNPTLTAAGLALFAGQSPGFNVAITHVAFGSKKYDPIGFEVALQAELARFPIDGSALISPSTIQVGVLMTNTAPGGTSANNHWIGEIGFYAGNTLFAVLSHAAAYLFFKSPDIDIPVTYVLDFSVLPPGSITVNNDALSSSIALASSYAQAAAKTASDSLVAIQASYYGPFATAPTARPDGSPRQQGDRYFDTNKGMEVTWSGGAWYIPNIDTAAFAARGGAARIGVAQDGDGAAHRNLQDKSNERVSALDYFLASELTAEGMINRAIKRHKRVRLPGGVLYIDPDVGVQLATGTVLTGDGKNKTILKSIYGGGSIAQLASYDKGSIVKRPFNKSTTVSGTTWYFAPYVSTDGGTYPFRVFNNTLNDHSDKTVTIFGTDANGWPQSEVMAMPTGRTGIGGRSITTKKYKTVTSAVPSASIGSDLMSVCLENPYVNDIYISDVAVLLSHPADKVTGTQIQIGFDMRNITGATMERCHAGNIAPVGGPLSNVYKKEFIVQGYPVVFGNLSAQDPAYCGGEKNRFLNGSVYGGYKCIIQDDVDLSPNSASYGTIVRGNDIQTGHWLIGQMGQYGAGNIHTDNILQDIQKRSGDTSPSYVQYYAGYNNLVRPAYIEAGSNVDYQLYLETTANNNRVEMLMAGSTSGASAIVDNSNENSYNTLTYYGLDGIGELIELYNKAYKRAWVKFHWDGANIVIDKRVGVASVTRTGIGDYLVTWERRFASSGYGISITCDTNVSGHAGAHDVYSHSSSNIRVLTYTQNTGAPTLSDPRFVWVSANQ